MQFDYLVPEAPFSIVDDLSRILKFLRDNYSYYYKKYFDLHNDKIILSACLFAEKWAEGKKLKEVINLSCYRIKE